MNRAYILACMLVGLACFVQAQEWTEVRCPPNAPYTFCTLEEEACDAGCFVVRFSPDGHRLATISDPPNNKIRIWDLRSGQVVHVFHAEGTWTTFVTIDFSPDGKFLAALEIPAPPPHEPLPPSLQPAVKVWEVSTGKELYTLRERASWIAFSPNGKWLATCSFEDGTVKLWEASSGLEVCAFTSDRPVFITFSPVHNAVVINENYMRLRIFDLDTKADVFMLTEAPDFRGPAAFSPDGSFLVTGASDGVIRVWDVSTGQLTKVLLGHTAGVLSLAFSPDGRLLASTAKDHTLRLWSLASGQALYTLNFLHMFGLGTTYSGEQLQAVVKMTRVFAVDFSSDGKLLASGVRVFRPGESCPCRGMVHLWRIAEMAER